MDKLKKVVYQFLDGYVGDGINVETETRPTYDILHIRRRITRNNVYYIYFNKGILILIFKVCNNGLITIFRGVELCNMVSDFFSLQDDESMRFDLTTKYVMKVKIILKKDVNSSRVEWEVKSLAKNYLDSLGYKNLRVYIP
jgi:hypothetical protein